MSDVQTFERSSHMSEVQSLDASMDDPNIEVYVRFGRSLYGGLRVLGFPSLVGVTGRIISHTPTSFDSVAEIGSQNVCWFLLRLHNPPLQIQSSPGQTVIVYADSASLAPGRQELNSLLCCIDSSVLIVSLVQIPSAGWFCACCPFELIPDFLLKTHQPTR